MFCIFFVVFGDSMVILHFSFDSSALFGWYF